MTNKVNTTAALRLKMKVLASHKKKKSDCQNCQKSSYMFLQLLKEVIRRCYVEL